MKGETVLISQFLDELRCSLKTLVTVVELLEKLKIVKIK